MRMIEARLVEKLDRKRFHVTVLAAAKNDDVTSKRFREVADEYLELPADTAPADGSPAR